ncbi:hypothetical protein BaRGS_00011481 [Batillaria attramentaria]|uniref:NOL1/NOP2/Sun domain family member 4 n=1 Tax=Batillaria attramentaria TaxID=370345 RepID=A0ABD0LDX7_9CAEN
MLQKRSLVFISLVLPITRLVVSSHQDLALPARLTTRAFVLKDRNRTEMATVTQLRWPSLVSISHRCCFAIQKRYRYKKKWAVNLPSKTSCELALDHFDAFYQPLFGRRWPSVRVSLLSLPKYAAIVNNASDRNLTIETLTELGAHDIISLAARKTVNNGKRFHEENLSSVAKEEELQVSSTPLAGDNGHVQSHGSDLSSRTSLVTDDGLWVENDVRSSKESRVGFGEITLPDSSKDFESLQSHGIQGMGTGTGDIENVLTPDEALRSKDLQYFVPTEQVFSEKEQLLREELERSTFEERPISVSVLSGQTPGLPTALQVLTYPAGDVSDFPRPRADQAGLLNYYLLDAASILPVIALDLQPHDDVLDLCAAPGGKTLAMLQMIITQGGHLTSNDVSQARLRRLQTVLKSYLSPSLQSEFVTVKKWNGLGFSEPVYSKVLVDVPCSSDRHVLTEEDNNLFKPSRITERLQMTALQKDLLLAGIRSCKPGGAVVYSTCTLAAAQNDGVIQAACLTNNFGPMYFCKLRRLN